VKGAASCSCLAGVQRTVILAELRCHPSAQRHHAVDPRSILDDLHRIARNRHSGCLSNLLDRFVRPYRWWSCSDQVPLESRLWVIGKGVKIERERDLFPLISFGHRHDRRRRVRSTVSFKDHTELLVSETPACLFEAVRVSALRQRRNMRGPNMSGMGVSLCRGRSACVSPVTHR
jgi:hypothetical protein